MSSVSNEFFNLIPQSQKENLLPIAFMETANVIKEYITASRIGEDVHWVCDSAPGHGKTTALKQVLMKECREPLLIVFNNRDTMRSFYNSVFQYYKEEIGATNIIQYVDADNLDSVTESLSGYLFVCITQQRLRDLAIGMGNKNVYMSYQAQEGMNRRLKKRQLIIDEMPIFFNDCEFDISEENNSVAWFDELAKSSDLEEFEAQSARITIMSLIVNELKSKVQPSTMRLIRTIEGSKEEMNLRNALGKLTKNCDSPTLLRQFEWFLKLLDEDGSGYIDRQRGLQKILCSVRIDYRKLGSVLILDGSSPYSKILYNNEYQFIEMENYHDYSRLFVHWRDINTNLDARRSPSKGVQQAISDDIKLLRDNEYDVFPLMHKGDTKDYLNSGVITSDQAKLFNERESDNDLPLNLLNTVGKNVLSGYDSLALLNLPIRYPVYYKKIAIGIYGTDIDLSMAEKGIGRWFQDIRVEQIYNECLISELIQIIHRSGLRNVTATSDVNIFIYSKSEQVVKRLSESLNVPSDNFTTTKLNNNSLYGFGEKCREWAVKTREFCLKHESDFNNTLHLARKVGGRPFKEWLNSNWVKAERRRTIEQEFSNMGLIIQVEKNGYKKIGLA
ncbi:hypothetical protein [Paenibacillus sp. FSL R5-0914]|uniref:hypothetical protein n=1 Tax=Paenibacillus sp. FSL R5-0914 TaxID=2921665 RepID=UPI0030FAB89B